MLQVGVVYTAQNGLNDGLDDGLYLAVDRDLLVTVAGGRPAYRRLGADPVPRRKLTEIVDLPVAELCARWGLSVGELGTITDPYFIPAEGGRCIASAQPSAYLNDWLTLWARRARTGRYNPAHSAGTPRRRGGHDPQRGRLLRRGGRRH